MDFDHYLMDYRSRCLSGASETNPVGYTMSNGIVVVWDGKIQHNYATMEYAKVAYPNLTIIHLLQQKI